MEDKENNPFLLLNRFCIVQTESNKGIHMGHLLGQKGTVVQLDLYAFMDVDFSMTNRYGLAFTGPQEEQAAAWLECEDLIIMPIKSLVLTDVLEIVVCTNESEKRIKETLDFFEKQGEKPNGKLYRL